MAEVELSTRGDAVSEALETWIGAGDYLFGNLAGVKNKYPIGTVPGSRETSDAENDVLAADYGAVIVGASGSAQNFTVQLEATIPYGAGFYCLFMCRTASTLTFITGANINFQTSELVWDMPALPTGVFLKKRAGSNLWLLSGATVAP